MVKNKTKLVRIDLNQFKLHLYLKPEIELTLHFDSPSRSFYLSVISLVIYEMKKRGRITSIPLQKYFEELVLLNKTVGAVAGSSKKKHLLPRIYRKWKDALPDLENAPLFKVVGQKKRYNELMEKVYRFSEAEKDSWANLFEYMGSHENVRLRFSIDQLSASLEDVVIVYGEHPKLTDTDAWEAFIGHLRKDTEDRLRSERANYKVIVPERPMPKPRGWPISMPSNWRWMILFTLIGLVVSTTAFVIRQNIISGTNIEVASIEKMAFPLPEKPSIAVLPFINIGDDPKGDYFCDGLTEEIITGLSKFRNLFVIARSSMFTYKGKPVKVQQVSEQLGVRYVMEGSVRYVKDRIRVTAQLIDGIKGHHLWAESYDRNLQDIFTIQDEITLKILKSLMIQFSEGEKVMLLKKHTDSLQAYLKLLEGIKYLDTFQIHESIRCIKEAQKIDPHYALAYGWEAWLQLQRVYSPNPSFTQVLNEAFDSAQRCVALNDDLAWCKSILSMVYILKKDYDRALFNAKKAVELEPNSASAATFLGWNLRLIGRHEEAIKELERALRLNPLFPAITLCQLGATYILTGQNEEAITKCKQATEFGPNILPFHVFLAVAYSSAGRIEEALSTAKKIMKLEPNFSLEHFAKILPHKNDKDRELMLNGLLKAGLK